MERRPRRYWAWLTTAGATLVILAAAASSLFQVAVQSLPGYRGEVEQYVRQLTGRPVRIGALALSWHYYYPTLDLVDIALLTDDEQSVVLQAERLRLGFGLTRLVRGDYRPDRLQLNGFAVDARVDADGRVNVRGIASENTRDSPIDALKPLTEFAQLRLERCRLNVRDERDHGEVYSFGIEHAELDRGLLGYDIDAEVALPASVGDTAHLSGSLTGEPLDPKTWSGKAELELLGLAPAAWLQPYLARGTRLEMSNVEGKVGASFEQGKLTGLDVALHTGTVKAQRGRYTAGLDELQARVAVEIVADGWKAELKKFALAGARGSWPHVQGELRVTGAADTPPAYDALLSYADLGDLAPWLRMIDAPPALMQFDQASGVVRDAQFRIQGHGDDARYSYRARFEQLALPAGERSAGFSGLGGELAGDESGGRAVLQEAPLVLDLPGVLATPVVSLDRFEAELEWSDSSGPWQLRLPQFHWSLLGTHGSGHLTLDLPSGERPAVIDLGAQFAADDVTRAKPLMPLHWGTGLRTWLDRSIVAGRAPKAELTIKGPLPDFPYQDKATGVFALDIDARDCLLAYQPDWPAIEGIDASLAFRGNSLSIQASRGSVVGNPIKAATAKFPDFRTGQLLIDGSVSGETANFYEFLRRSPLREKFKGLLGQTKAAGPSTVEIHLDMPVEHAEDTGVSGRVTTEGVELRHSALPEPVREIKGQIVFGPAGINADKVTGRLYELPLEGKLVAQDANTTLLTAGFRLAIDPQGKGASQLIPAWLRKKVVGVSNWTASLPIGGDADSTVTLNTDLVGVAVNYPAPIGKPAEQPVPLTLGIGSLPEAPLHITADYKDRLGADLRFIHVGDTLPLDRAAVRAGGGVPAPADDKGISLSGDVPEMDLQLWTGELQGAGAGEEVHRFKRADLHIGRAAWDRYALKDVRYQWASQKDGWALALSGPGATGSLRWTTAERGTLAAKLDALALEYVPPAPDEVAGNGVIDPNAQPVLDLNIAKFTLNQDNIGRVVFATQRTEAGQAIKLLKIDSGTVAAGFTGEWRRRAGQSSASLNGDFVTNDIAAFLKAFGYQPNLDAKAARIKTDVTWAPTERGLEWHDAQGKVHLEFENGQLRAVNPGGAGRVLGLVNFFALPRRLSLNFRDVVGSGLGFDKIDGDFELKDGSAYTQNLHVAGPSLKMDVTGRIGLAARDYDQQVTVYPDVSSGVTIGALLLGGPVAGALTLIAQELLKKPLNQVTQLSYRVTGSWDNPQVQKAPTQPAPPKPDKAAAPQAQAQPQPAPSAPKDAQP